MMEDQDRYEFDRNRMVDEQLVARGITNQRLLEAMRSVPRHHFLAPENRHLAYTDGPLPIAAGQTISQPYIVALMTQLLHLAGPETVLEIGTGSGYQAAILAYLAAEVHTVERHPELARQAEAKIAELGLENVTVHLGDGSLGLPDFGPYAGIVATAAAPVVPEPYFEQLAEGGRLVIPVGGPDGQVLQLWYKRESQLDHEVIAPVAFVPLRGKHGWGEDSWRY